MSKLIERLQLLSKATAHPMGFRIAAVHESPSMLLIASLSQPDVVAAAAVAGDADAVLIGQGDLKPKKQSFRNMVKAMGDTPWGVGVSGVSSEEISQLVVRGCDFLVFAPATTPMAVLQEKGAGKILELESPQDEALVSSADLLPLDAILVRGNPEGESFLTVQCLMNCHHLANLLHKPLLLAAPSGLTSADLEALWIVGIDGVVLEIEGPEVRERLSQLRQAIKTLPPITKRQRGKIDLLLPQLGEAVVQEEEE